MAVNFPTDPKVIGPGCWYAIHVLGWNSRTDDEIKHFCKVIRDIVNRFPCGDCRKHAQEYLSVNPPESFTDFKYNNENVGMFKYTVDFHNHPNKRLGKPLVEFKTAYDAFNVSDIGFCNEGCEHEDSKSTENKLIRTGLTGGLADFMKKK